MKRGEVRASDHPGQYTPEKKAAEIARLKARIAHLPASTACDGERSRPPVRAANKDARAWPRWHAGRSSAGRAAVQSRSGYGGKPQSAAPIEAAGRSISPTVAGGRRAKILQKTPEPPGGYVPEHCDDFCRQVRGLEAHAQDHSHFCGRFCACLFWFSSGCLMPEAMADEAPVVRHITRITVRTVAPIRLVEFGAGLYVLMGIPVTPFTEHMGPMAEPDFGGAYTYTGWGYR